MTGDLTETLTGNPDVARYPDRARIGLARNIVNQILDESGASVETRQAINDRCDEFVDGLLAALVAAEREKAARVAWFEGWDARALRHLNPSPMSGVLHNPYAPATEGGDR